MVCYKHHVVRTEIESNILILFAIPVKLQGGARTVIPLIVHITNFYYYKTFDIWYKINQENVTQLRAHIVKLCRALSEDLCRVKKL